ncbi:MAG: hypothetical protein KDD83_18910, partial [Caldilineaceae bacterium]|nr:hypothetical protein [Caldilineaceae bacterium]
QAVFLTSRPDAEDITTALEAVLTTWAAPVSIDLDLTVPGARIEGADGGRHGDDAATLDVGDLPAHQARWVVGRVPRAEETLHVQLRDGTEIVAEVSVNDTTDEMAAIKPLFGVRRVNALEFLSSARYEDAALREQLQRLGYDPATVLPTGQERSVYAETAAKETAAALHDLLRDEALRYGLLTSVTAFVAVRTEAGHAVDREVVVANALPEGWSSQFVGAFGTPGVRSMRSHAGPMAMPPRPKGPEMFAAGMPPAAQMPAAAQAMVPGPAGGGAMPAWRTVFHGTLPAGAEAVLYDSPGDEASGELISALRVTFDGAAPNAAALQDVTLLLYVGDTALPRARVRLADLLRTPERPLNVARRPGDLLRLVLTDPEGRLAEGKPAVQIEVQVKET